MLFGQQSSDSDGAVLWAAVAERLKRPVISQVAELTLDGSALTGKRQTEFGYDVIRAPLPAVVAVADSINEPRYLPEGNHGGEVEATGDALARRPRGRCGQRREPGSHTEVLALPIRRREATRKLEDDGSAAEQIVALPRRG